FSPNGGTVQNCATLPAACEPVGTTSPACLAAAGASFVADGVRPGAGKRSLIHADATYLMAQAVGFAQDDAYLIAAVAEVPDYGQFEPYDMNGQPVGGGSLQTVALDGFVRSNTTTGGTFFHCVMLYNGGSAAAPAGVDGLHPDLQSASVEYFVVHVRNWASGTGASPVLCTAGLTNASASGDYATGASCYAENGS